MGPQGGSQRWDLGQIGEGEAAMLAGGKAPGQKDLQISGISPIPNLLRDYFVFARNSSYAPLHGGGNGVSLNSFSSY